MFRSAVVVALGVLALGLPATTVSGLSHSGTLFSAGGPANPPTVACGLLPNMYPILNTGANSTPFPSPFPKFPTLNFTNNSSGGRGNVTMPPGLNFSWWNVTVGQVRLVWSEVCTAPAFVQLVTSQPPQNFSQGWSGNTINHTAAISVGYDWVAACQGNLSSPWGSANASSRVPSYANGTQCTNQEYWSGEFLPNGTENVSGPYRFEGIAVYNGPATSPPPSTGSLYLGTPVWVIVAAVAAAAGIAAAVGVASARPRENATADSSRRFELPDDPPPRSRASETAGGTPSPDSAVGTASARSDGEPDPLADLL
ncbi:MAG TPA: hypothetical protein VGV89_07585 [Thermoplasmata archaeon]|nr:hypothetical protein [Thermoplasmata archaeon]